MSDPKALIAQAYAAFNQRNIDAALALMTPDVSWPKASEGGKVIGKEEIRAYWTRQWADFDPHVKPLAITEQPDGKLYVPRPPTRQKPPRRVLSDTEVLHIFTMTDGLISAMDLGDEANPRYPLRRLRPPLLTS